MNPIRSWAPVAALAFLGACVSMQAMAWTNPPIRTTQQGIEYMCGGKGSAEREFMKMVSPRWSATLEFSVNRGKAGEVPGDVKIVVRERYTRRPIMEAATGSPYMLARLDPGAYEIEATLGGLTLEQPLTVFDGLPSRAAFVWPSNIDFAAAAAAAQPEQQAAANIH